VSVVRHQAVVGSNCKDTSQHLPQYFRRTFSVVAVVFTPPVSGVPAVDEPDILGRMPSQVIGLCKMIELQIKDCGSEKGISDHLKRVGIIQEVHKEYIRL
jgi:hypothetical protein